jgi:uncharacterized phage-associated protein
MRHTNRQRLEDAITLVVENSPRTLTRTGLVKLLYFIDLRSWEQWRQPLTGLNWTWHYYGPFSEEIAEVMGDMEASGELTIAAHQSYFGTPEYQIELGDEAALYPALSPDEEQLLKQVVSEFGQYPASTLARLSYQTDPMETVERRGDRLDFEKYASGSPSILPFVPDPHADPSSKMASS